MLKFLITILISFLTVLIVHGQNSIDDFPTKDIIKNAKKETKANLDSLSEILKLSRNEARLKKFNLDFCKDKRDFEFVGIDPTPAGDFPAFQGCPSIYKFIHRTRKYESGYIISFYYNRQGKIVEKEISYVYIIH